jgi:alkylation response protein AidB-like acyl-CoA dehydrogenase
MKDIFVGQVDRLLGQFPPDPAAAQAMLEASGFLDILRPEHEGGAGAVLSELVPIALLLGRKLADERILGEMLSRGLGRGLERHHQAAAAAALMSGAMESVLDMTLEYVKTREQFGRKISNFQAVQQQFAVLVENASAARAAIQFAFDGTIEELTPQRAAIAKISCGQSAIAVTTISHALHGAIGMSSEHALHRYTRQLECWRNRHGGEHYWSEQLGGFLIAGGQRCLTFARQL